MGIISVLSTEHKMFGVPKGGIYHIMEKEINHVIIVAKCALVNLCMVIMEIYYSYLSMNSSYEKFAILNI